MISWQQAGHGLMEWWGPGVACREWEQVPDRMTVQGGGHCLGMLCLGYFELLSLKVSVGRGEAWRERLERVSWG